MITFLRMVPKGWLAAGALLLALGGGYVAHNYQMGRQEAKTAKAEVAVAECKVALSKVQAQVVVGNEIARSAQAEAKTKEANASERAKAVLNERPIVYGNGAEEMNKWLDSL